MGQSPQAPSSSSGGLEPNIAALLGYLIGILAVVWLVIEPYNKDRFIRFHAFQAIGLFIAWFVLMIALTILSVVLAFIPYVGGVIALLLWPVFGLAIFVVWVLLMVKAYQKQMWKLPVIGNFAEQMANKV